MRYLIPVMFLPTLAQADAGAHLHPHGIDAPWIAAAIAVAAGGLLIRRFRR